MSEKSVDQLMTDAGATVVGGKPDTEQKTQTNEQNTQNVSNAEETQKSTDDGVANQTSNTQSVTTDTNKSSEQNVSQDDVYKIDRFNKEIGREFKDIGEVKGLLERAEKVGKLEEQLNSLKEIYSKTNKPWANDKVQRLNEIYKKNPDVPINVVSALASENLDEMSPKELLIWKHRLENPNDSVDKSKLSKFIDMNYGLGKDPSTIEDDGERAEHQEQYDYNQFRLNTEANKFRQELKSKFDVDIKDDVNVDEVINNFTLERETSVNERKVKFEPIVESLSKDFNNFKITDPATNEVLIDVVIDEKFKQGLPGFIMKTALDQGLDPANLQDVAKLKKLMSDVYFVNNKHAILKKFASNMNTQAKDSQYDEQHNTNSTSTYSNNAPTGNVKSARVGSKAQVNAEIAKDLGIGS